MRKRAVRIAGMMCVLLLLMAPQGFTQDEEASGKDQASESGADKGSNAATAGGDTAAVVAGEGSGAGEAKAQQTGEAHGPVAEQPVPPAVSGAEEVKKGLEAEAAAPPVVTREAEDRQELADEVVRKIREEVTLQLKKELKEEITSEARLSGWPRNLPSWVNSITIGGDLRVGFEGQYYDDDNDAEVLEVTDPTELMNTTEDRKRLRGRLRLDITAKVTDRLEAGMRIASGDTGNPVSTSVTFGDYFNKHSLALDRLYLRYKPMPELALWAGRFPNPFLCTELVWDNDVNFEGAAFQLNTQLQRHVRGFITAGYFPIQEEEWTSDDKLLLGGQVGLQVSFTPVVSIQVAGAYYDFKHITGEANDPSLPGEYDWTAPGFQQKGNTVFDIDPDTSYLLALASDYNELDLFTSVDFTLSDPLHLVFTFDYVKNLGFDKSDVAARTGISEDEVSKEIAGYQAGVSVGHLKVREFGAWRVFLNKRRLEGDAVIDAFTDSTFHDGGTNAKGTILGLELGLARNTWLSAAWYSTDEISGPQIAVDTLQVYVNVQF